MSGSDERRQKEAQRAWNTWKTDRETFGVFGFFLAVVLGGSAGYPITIVPLSLLQVIFNLFGGASGEDGFWGPLLSSVWSTISGPIIVLGSLAGVGFFLFMRKSLNERRHRLLDDYGPPDFEL